MTNTHRLLKKEIRTWNRFSDTGLTSPTLTVILQRNDVGVWAWSLCETFHFVGLCLLVGIVGMFDLRVLGMAKGLPLAALQRLLPWGVFGIRSLSRNRPCVRLSSPW